MTSRPYQFFCFACRPQFRISLWVLRSSVEVYRQKINLGLSAGQLVCPSIWWKFWRSSKPINHVRWKMLIFTRISISFLQANNDFTPILNQDFKTLFGIEGIYLKFKIQELSSFRFCYFLNFGFLESLLVLWAISGYFWSEKHYFWFSSCCLTTFTSFTFWFFLSL